jgi:hypothetical protein
MSSDQGRSAGAGDRGYPGIELGYRLADGAALNGNR